mmetsp:Transcript_18405/g.31476  ORF Transcript_18405/g.31476 Transcript_18405/m.31476 type:complete len:99 (+) Transcript_18405:741-1037(+)
MFADQVAANSSWTRGHVDNLWKKTTGVETVYPPCDTSQYIEKITIDTPRDNLIISFAQFRPEKQHTLQLKVWKQVLEDEKVPRSSIFTMIGTVRGRED